MTGAKRWGYILTAVTIVAWGAAQFAGWGFPNWLLVIAGLVIFTLFTVHYAEEYTP